MLKLISPANGTELSLSTQVQKEFIRREYGIVKDASVKEEPDAYPWLTPELTCSRYLSTPASVIFKWQSTDPLTACYFELSTSADFAKSDKGFKIATLSDVYTDPAEPDVYCIRADNLFVGTTYYWRVTTESECLTASFSTAKGEIRFINAGSVKNVRDTGGRINEDGRTVKQGLIYRGGEADQFESAKGVGNVGIGIMLHDLGIKSDVDLRYESEGCEKSPIGKAVSYNFLPMHAYGGTLNDGGRASVRRILEFMADENNYPIFYHCVAGADRTGTIGMYLDAILDMADEDIILNYNVTSLADDTYRNWYVTRDNVTFIGYLDETYPTLSVKEKLMENIRLSGISEETLQKIRDNLLE